MLKADRPLVLVNGIGGIGKTTLAQKYWEQYEKDYQLKAWIDCPDGLLKGLGNSSLPDSLEIDQSQLTAEKELLSKVVHALSNKGTGPHLLVIDNANEANDLKQLQRIPGWEVLITSRVEEPMQHLAKKSIGELEPEEARRTLWGIPREG